ncbi:zinc finger protein 221-like protein [Lates japonicus]|uniref:Zinc finger protein 221-like protein n=1 Tax=Lates japonicus TaxID=270547 RepID=A0AAD3NB33_LATJO|nr:zinc finger protein 221-like protein [Lates japonicus]
MLERDQEASVVFKVSETGKSLSDPAYGTDRKQVSASRQTDRRNQDPGPHIKEEQEEVWSSQEENSQGLEEAMSPKFTSSCPCSEDDEETSVLRASSESN